MSEQVLVFPAPRLEPYLPRFAGGIVTDPAVIEDVLDDVLCATATRFMDRPSAEEDSRFKQVIPYCVLWAEDEDGGCVFMYRRSKKGGEGRLHEKWSLGVGGHINPCDGVIATGTYGSTFPPLYDAAVRRELEEEVSLQLGPDLGMEAPVIALIYDDSNDVGKVHFGVVHLVKVPSMYTLKFTDPAMDDYRWTSNTALKWVLDPANKPSQNAPALKLENWSKLVAANVKLPG